MIYKTRKLNRPILLQVVEMLITKIQILAYLSGFLLESPPVVLPSSLPSRLTLLKSECKRKLARSTELDGIPAP